MGKKTGTVVLFLGAFLLALAVLSKFYMYDRVAVAPLNTDTVSIAATAPGDDATYLDPSAGLATVNGPLKSTKLVQGDVEASKQASKDTGRDVAVYDSYSCTDVPSFDCGSGETPLSASTTRVAFDIRTGEAVDWDGAFYETGGKKVQPFDYDGQIFKFPFDTQKKTYQWWDSTLGATNDVEFVGEDTVKGMKVYNFEGSVEPTKIGEQELPGDLIGSDEASVLTDKMYSTKRTFSVDPVTGAVIVGGESQDNYFAVDGARVLTSTQATLVLTDEVIQDGVDEYKPLAFLITLVKTWIPLVGGLVGLLLIGFGLRIWRREDHQHKVRKTDKGELVGSR